jgi:putative hemolysin
MSPAPVELHPASSPFIVAEIHVLAAAAEFDTLYHTLFLQIAMYHRRMFAKCTIKAPDVIFCADRLGLGSPKSEQHLSSIAVPLSESSFHITTAQGGARFCLKRGGCLSSRGSLLRRSTHLVYVMS